MLSRRHGYLVFREDGPTESRQLEEFGYAVLHGVLAAVDIADLTSELERVYADEPPRHAEDFRYCMLNKSAVAQRIVGHPAILRVLEPLLGEDCHVIANTAWRNPAGAAHTHAGGQWHQDGGPHIPRSEGVPWDDRIPYPIFAVGAHILLRDCDLASGPTGVLPGSHRSGRTPPADRIADPTLTYEGHGPVALVGKAGDVGLFVSDSWHRRLPTGSGDQGRVFLQAHYARRDIAQRLQTTDVANHLSDEAIARAGSTRERTLIGLHPPHFYDG